MALFLISFPLKFFTFAFLLMLLAPIKHASSVSSTSSDYLDPAASVYDILNFHGLPIGLFPKGISDFKFDSVSGRFELHLSQSSCDAKFETNVRYAWNVSGTISYGSVSGISGVAAQELFLWFPVKGIRVDIPSSGLIYFDVGVVSKQFSLSFFDTPHDCILPTGVDDQQERFSLVDLPFLEDSGRSVQLKNSSEKSLEGVSEGNSLRAIS